MRGGKGAYFQGGVRGASWVHMPEGMMHPSLVGTTNFELSHVTDWLPTIVSFARGGEREDGAGVEGGGEAVKAKRGGRNNTWSWAKPLDGMSLYKTLTQGAPSGRADVLINIERDHATTAPPTAGGQYAVVVGRYKLIVGGGGEPNTWYHDGAPYNGSEPTPQGGCIKANTPYAPDACPAAPPVQVYDVIADEGEHHDLAPTNATLVAALMKVLRKYNESEYVDALYHRVPLETTCPKTAGGVLTPC